MAKEKPRKKGYDYFEYFCASARYACQAAEHLEKSLPILRRKLAAKSWK